MNNILFLFFFLLGVYVFRETKQKNGTAMKTTKGRTLAMVGRKESEGEEEEEEEAAVADKKQLLRS